MNRAVCIFSAKAVFDITFNGCTHLGELCPNLVVTARMEDDFEQMIIVDTVEQLVAQLRFFGSWAVGLDHEGFVQLAIFFEVIDALATDRVRRLTNHGQVGFLDVPLLELLVDMDLRVFVPRKEHHSAGGSIDTVGE